MPIDASLLNDLQAPAPIDWAKYKGPGSYTPPPVPVDAEGKAIQFTGVVPATIEFGATADKHLKATLDGIKIQGNDYTIRFQSVSAKKFTDSKTGAPIEASMMGNFLRSVDKNQRPQSVQEWVKAVESTARKTFKFTADWDCYDSETGTTVAKTYSDFPVDPANPSKRQPFIEGKDGRRLYARLKIKQFVPMK